MATMTAAAKAQVLTVKAESLKTEPEFPDIATIRAAIPEHCFQPTVARSMSYLFRDLIMAGALGWAALTFIPQIPDATSRTAAWVAYGFVQGLIGTGIWILGHECGHGAFSRHQRFNNCVGWFTHSLLLVPYFSWKYSHHRHHRYTGHMEKDMAFVPRTRAEYLKKTILPKLEFLEDTPAYHLVKLVFHQIFGWFAYLFLNATAGSGSLQKDAHALRRSHFDPLSAVFRPNEAFFIFMSDVGLAITFYGLYQLAGVIGAANVWLLYAQPYFWVHHWLVAITFLHHTHHDVPHYSPENWTFVKGALATVDREFGFIGKHLFHGIIEKHVVHHLFPRIPFYHADEATEAIKPVIGDHYRRDDRSFLGQLYEMFSTCKYVEPDEARPGTLKWVTRVRS